MITSKWFEGNDILEDAHEIRRKVFIQEQNVAEHEEMDGTDGGASHLVVYDNGQAVATGRLMVDNGLYIAGRVAVLKEHRGKGYGDLVMRMLIRKSCMMGAERQHVHAQLSAEGFYKKLGFTRYGEEYMEAGIPHINMVHEGDVMGSC